MNVKVTEEGDKITIFLSGSIDIPSAENLKKKFGEVLETDVKEVHLDFSDVVFIGSSGIGKLLVFYKTFTTKGGTIFIENLNTEIMALFRAIKLDRIFNMKS